MLRTTLILCLLGCLAPLAQAIQTHVLRDRGLEAFAEGTLENLSLNEHGRLEPAPALKQLSRLDDPVVWAAVADADGNVYIGTGNRGRVLKLDPDGELTTVFNPDSILVRALAVDEAGNLYVGTAPQGAIYRVKPDGGYPELFHDPDAAYIWDFQVHDGALWATTGYAAELWRIPLERDEGAEAERWFHTHENHFTTLRIDEEMGILVGSAPNGIVYQIQAAGEGYALSRAPEEEVSSIWVEGERIWFATVSAEDERSGGNSGRQGSRNDLAPPSSGNSNAGQVRPSRDSRISRSGLYVRHPNGFVEPVWQSGDEGITSLLRTHRGFWLMGLDTDGKILALESRDSWSWIQRAPNGGEISWLMPAPDSPRDILVFTSNPGAIYRLGGRGESGASYTSAVRDSSQPVRWGKLEIALEGELDLTVETRSGNTPEPDNVWSEWVVAEEEDAYPGIWRGQVASPPARYLQYRIAFGEERLDGAVNQVRTFVQLPNVAPYILNLRVLPFGVDAMTASSGNRQFDLESMLQADDPEQLGSPTQPRTQFARMPDPELRTIAWRAYDPNDDRMRFDVDIKRLGSGEWVRLQRDLEETHTLLNLNGLEEGYYRARVQARDDLDNPPEVAGKTRRVSEPFLVDHQPPVIAVQERKVEDGTLRLRLQVRDEWSVIRQVRVRVDGGDAVALRPVDGIYDSHVETFDWEWELPAEGDANVSVVIDAIDESGRRASHAFSLPRTGN